MSAQPKETLAEILNLMGFAPNIEEQKLDDGILLDVKAEDSGRLIGRQGQTLADLQYITNRILFQQDTRAPKVLIDVGGYRSEAREILVKKALAAADKVRRWGDIVELEPMAAFDRRIVHQALRDDPDVETQSVEVDGTEKKALLLRPRHPIAR
jgi:spoIIIJ-associated protein